MEGVSVLHEEPFNEFGEKSWSKYTLHKAADLKFYEHHLDCFSWFSFWNGQGVAHGWVSELIMSLPQVVLLPAGTLAKDRLDRKKPVSASLETELESQPQNMINFNEVAKDACLPPEETLVCFLSAEDFKRVNLKSKSLLPSLVG